MFADDKYANVLLYCTFVYKNIARFSNTGLTMDTKSVQKACALGQTRNTPIKEMYLTTLGRESSTMHSKVRINRFINAYFSLYKA